MHTLTFDQLARYRALRASGSTPLGASIEARTIVPPRMLWTTTAVDERAHTMHDGWNVVVSIVPDPEFDTSYLGTFTRERGEGSIFLYHYRMRPRSGALYFHPAMTEDYHYNALRALNYGRAEAHTLARGYVQHDYKRALAFGETWHGIGVRVTVSASGVEFAQASLYGIESDCGREYIEQVARDLTPEATGEANETLSKICRGER